MEHFTFNSTHVQVNKVLDVWRGTKFLKSLFNTILFISFTQNMQAQNVYQKGYEKKNFALKSDTHTIGRHNSIYL